MKASRILKLKSKFFFFRAVTYSFFLLFPIWVQKSLGLNPAMQALMMLLYIMFLAGQWYLLGKEIDHRLKIYVRVNSSMDKVLYRFIMGNVVMILYFGLLSFLPQYLLKHFFWGTWVVLGLFYSWPTRGKIIQESVSSQMGEFRFLDAFEKTVLGLSVVLFAVSLPELPLLENIEALKLYFDPSESFHPQIWNFLAVNYFPFKKYSELYRLALCMHFYVVGLGVFILAFYALLRVFISRRLSILGIFAILSAWPFAKILTQHFSAAMTTTFSVVWVWSLLWVTKSSSYRAGLFIGLLHYYATILNASYVVFLPLQLLMLYFFFLDDKTTWFKRQLLKYTLFGGLLAVMTTFSNFDSMSRHYALRWTPFWAELVGLINRKAFFVLSIIGLLIVVITYIRHYTRRSEFGMITQMQFDKRKLDELLLAYGLVLVMAFCFDENLGRAFSLMWMLAFMSLVPIEWIFQSIYRLRSRRNMIYGAYVLICLLDSHFEGRIKTIAKLFHH